MAACPLVEVRMVRPDLSGLPSHPVPAPYLIRPYQTGDAAAWVAVQQAAERHHEDLSLDLFRRQFGEDEDLLTARQLLVCDEGGGAVGTATAWVNDHARFSGQAGWGRIHWVAVVPRLQGRGLGQALVSALCRRFEALGHSRVYLTTETVRLPAIRLYRAFGFVPDIENEDERRIWRAVEKSLAKETHD